MKNLTKILAIGALITSVGVTSVTAFAASKYTSPADIVAGLTGRTTDSVIEEHINENKTYGTIANEASKIEEFKKENLELKKETINEKVTNGTITQDEANKLIKTIEENQSNCDGSGSSNKMKLGLNRGKGQGKNFQNGNCLNQ